MIICALYLIERFGFLFFNAVKFSSFQRLEKNVPLRGNILPRIAILSHNFDSYVEA
jgi:hypothetical protein